MDTAICPCCGKPGFEPACDMVLPTGHVSVVWRLLHGRAGRWVEMPDFYVALWNDRDMPEHGRKIVHLAVMALRQRLPPGLAIENARDLGYRLRRTA